MYIIGTDEAGYGPNLGPLVISAAVWEAETADFSAVNSELHSKGIILGDSKKIYHSGHSPSALESGVLTALQTLAVLPDTLPELRRRIAETDVSDVPEFPVKIPYCVSRETIAKRAEIFQSVLVRHRIKLLALKSRVITAAEFNRLLGTYPPGGAKAALLSDAAVDLTVKCRELFCRSSNSVILCDKHGGRNRYLDILTHFFPGVFFQTVKEGREESIYRTQDIEFRFIAKGESHLPIALSSMLSKYIRELAMFEFNGYWRKRIPGLKPTAGYPEDAKRFIKEAAALSGNSLDMESLWRKR